MGIVLYAFPQSLCKDEGSAELYQIVRRRHIEHQGGSDFELELLNNNESHWDLHMDVCQTKGHTHASLNCNVFSLVHMLTSFGVQFLL